THSRKSPRVCVGTGSTSQPRPSRTTLSGRRARPANAREHGSRHGRRARELRRSSRRMRRLSRRFPRAPSSNQVGNRQRPSRKQTRQRTPYRSRGRAAARAHSSSRTKRATDRKDETMSDTIFLVGGGKGGVGKSLMSMALLDFLHAIGQRPFLVETDTSVPDVFKTYGEAVGGELVNLDEREGWIDLGNLVESSGESTFVINTGARNQTGISNFGRTL